MPHNPVSRCHQEEGLCFQYHYRLDILDVIREKRVGVKLIHPTLQKYHKTLVGTWNIS